MEQPSGGNVELSARVLERLASALREQGVAVELGEKVCQVGGEALSLSCRVVEQRARAAGDALVALNIQAVPGSDGGFTIQEQVAGVAPTPEEAVEQAVALWLEGVWPVLRTAFLGDEESTLNRFPLEAMNYEANRLVTWQVLTGPLQAVGSEAERLFTQLENSPPFALLLDELTRLMEAQSPRPYWLRLFLSRQADGTIAGEVRVNNQPWDTGLWALQGFDWPPLSEYAGFRQAVLLQPTE